MKKSKIFCLAAVAVLLFTLAACGGYTSKIYDNAQKWIKKDVLESNMTKAPDAEDSDLPKEICRLIDSREKSDEYFSDLPVDVDFSKEKMILYFYTSQYMGRSYKINKMDEMGISVSHIEGHRSNTWILLDYVDIIVHVFSDEAREYYSLERLWQDGKMEDISDYLID